MTYIARPMGPEELMAETAILFQIPHRLTPAELSRESVGLTLPRRPSAFKSAARGALLTHRR